ncbi:MAG: GTP-binding protein [Promethearchaeia archaeon]
MTQKKNKKSFIYKICIVGDGGVGKTSMVLRYTDNKFKENYIMTIGSNFASQRVDLPEYPNYIIKLQIWDLAGQKHFSFVRPPFYRGATGIIYVFDITRRSSFANLPDWKEEIEKVIEKKPCILIGNKVDLAHDRKVSKKDSESLMNELGCLNYLETSAKTGNNVDKVFREMTRGILKANDKI